MAYSYTPYKESDNLLRARQRLEEQLGARPGDYSSQTAEARQTLSRQILDRPAFTYDPGRDPLYRQYADDYTRRGRLAMEDTAGRAAALTGGYGSSYSQQAGQQAYDSYLTELSGLLPELYRLARDNDDRAVQELYDRYEILSRQESEDYSRYVDSLDQWLKERDYTAQELRDLRDLEYSRWADDRDFSYQQSRDDEQDRQWQADYDYKLAKDALSTAASGGGGTTARSNAGSNAIDGGTPPSASRILRALAADGNSDDVKDRQMTTVVSEAVARGELDLITAQKLLSKYRP